jgi:hypothetical protein
MFGWPRNIRWVRRMSWASRGELGERVACHDINLLLDLIEHDLLCDDHALENMLSGPVNACRTADEVDVREPAWRVSAMRINFDKF